MRQATCAVILITAALGLSAFAPATTADAASGPRALYTAQAFAPGARGEASQARTAGSVQPSSPHARAGLFAVSCTGAFFCLAVGSHTDRSGRHHALAEEWNGHSWRLLKDPPGKALRNISCTSASFCMASGPFVRGTLAGPVETWNGRTWRAQTPPTDARSAISCGGPRLCMAIRGIPAAGGPVSKEVESWNGRKWRTWTSTNACSGEPLMPCGLPAVSCGIAGSCVAVGSITINNNGDQAGFAYIWNGHGWDTGFPEPASPNLSEITCVRRGFCMAAAAEGSQAATWTAKHGGWTWLDVSPNLTALCGRYCFLGIIGCGGPRSCMVLPGRIPMFRLALAWNGSSWRATHPAAAPGASPYLDDVSCGTPTSCIAVGGYSRNFATWTLAERWNGRIWRLTKTFSPR